MAIQFARAEYVSRSSGKNACCKSAYNARSKVTDEKTGESIATAVKDLTDKQLDKLNELSKEEPKTLEESLKSQIIQSAMSKYSLVELWEKLK